MADMAESNLSAGLDATADLKAKQARLVAEMKEAHVKQMSILQTAIAEERHEMTQNQKMFEQTLHIKFDHLVSALQDKVKAENDAKMQRALDDLERSARNESERARQTFEAQQAAEAALSVKFKGIVGDLRKSWEEEEIARARQLEERLRAHYSAVLEHMEAQLQMALQLQDEADKQWMEDVEARNKQQVDALRRFEEKCRRLYDTRLKEYCEKTDQQMTHYEEQLLQVGSTLAIERGRVEGRQRRMKLACHRWKIEYQKDVDERYREMSAALETKYMDEVQSLLEQNANLQMGVTAAKAEQNVTALGLLPASQMRLNIQQLAKEHGLGGEEVANMLGLLLDAAPCNVLMQAEYENLVAFISNRGGGSGGGAALAVKSRREAVEHKRNLLKGGIGELMTEGSTARSSPISAPLQSLAASAPAAAAQTGPGTPRVRIGGGAGTASSSAFKLTTTKPKG